MASDADYRIAAALARRYDEWKRGLRTHPYMTVKDITAETRLFRRVVRDALAAAFSRERTDSNIGVIGGLGVEAQPIGWFGQSKFRYVGPARPTRRAEPDSAMRFPRYTEHGPLDTRPWPNRPHDTRPFPGPLDEPGGDDDD